MAGRDTDVAMHAAVVIAAALMADYAPMRRRWRERWC